MPTSRRFDQKPDPKRVFAYEVATEKWRSPPPIYFSSLCPTCMTCGQAIRWVGAPAFERSGGAVTWFYEVECSCGLDLIEWPTLGVIIGSSIFVEIAARSGIFTWSAIRLLKASKGDPWRLLLLLGTLTLLFSAFLNNVTAMIIIGSLTVVACKNLQMDAKPFLLVEAFLTNVGGLLTLISSLPNIILGHAAGITFLKFFLVAAPYCVIATVATLILAPRVMAATRDYFRRMKDGKSTSPRSAPAGPEVRH